MIVVQNHIPVKGEFRKQFEDAFIHGRTFLTTVKGFIRNDILRPTSGEDYIVMSYWNSMEEFTAWTESEEFRKAHKSTLPPDAFSGKNVLSVHEVIHTTTK